MECYLIGWMFLLECPRGPVWVHGYFWEGFHMWKFADDTTVSEVVPASNIIYIYSRLTCQESLLVTYSGK